MLEKDQPVVISDPDIGLKKKLSLPGGISREVALVRAQDHLDHQRRAATEDLVARIVALRQSGGPADRTQLSAEEVSELLAQLDEILNIAGTFHMWNLVTTTAFLYDILRAKPGRLNADALDTFTRAMHLFAIPSGGFEADGLQVLEQLRCLFDFVTPRPSGPAPLLRTA